jgi:peptidoglycan/xylan/chitin deacetylase (PgdA/CDA1 family)
LVALLAAVTLANAAAAGHLIGLCCREGVNGSVLEQVLKTEGVPFVRLHDLGQLEQQDLKGLVLGEGFDGAARQVETFLGRGGVLLSLKPSGRLAETLGLKEAGTQKDGHLTVDGKLAAMISYQGRLQIFGQSRLYQGGECLASLTPNKEFGGVIRVRRGPATALVVAFDLASTLLTILQPEAACGKHIDASNVEYDLGEAPQVDLVRRLLTGLFLDALDVPVMRKWYFPAQQRAMLVIVGDQDGATFPQLEVVLDLLKELQAPYTLYVTPTNQPVTREQFRILRQGGMELGLHPNFFKSKEILFNEEEFKAQLKKAEADIGSKITGERPHSGRWDSVRELPVWLEQAGLQYDSILGTKWWESRPSKYGYWLGTGLPYSFFHPQEDRRLDVLEIPICGSDNDCFWKPHPYTVRYKPGAHKTFLGGNGLTEDAAFQSWKRFFDQALEKYPAAIGYCWHPVYLAAKKLNLQERYYRTDSHFRQCVGYARSRKAGLTGANAWNDFWRAREKAALELISWNPATSAVQYLLAGDVKVDSLTLLTPLIFGGRKARISVNGRPQDYVETRLLGGQQAMFAVNVGREGLCIAVQYR